MIEKNKGLAQAEERCEEPESEEEEEVRGEEEEVG